MTVWLSGLISFFGLLVRDDTRYPFKMVIEKDESEDFHSTKSDCVQTEKRN
jgi:hypothetical protein